ncbi:MAG: ABC transporter ATP-binding protein [Anaerolineae bacterium]|jgi:ABC-2 type transport system ATP-binding protein|nr:ABC transporter ATP-binding protein [Anaerolineae bacterium]
MNAICTELLSKTYPNGNIGVQNLSFCVQEGEIVGLLGPNGAGKTTTVNLLSTVFPPTKGTASILGYDIVKQKNQIRAIIGVVSQEYALDWALSVYDHLMIFAEIRGLRPKEANQRIDLLLNQFDLTGKHRSRLLNLSGGQIRRVQLIRALLFEPKILFVDEPTLELDPKGVKITLGLLREFAQSGTTIVLASNAMAIVEELCDRVIFLRNGTILDQGPTYQFLSKYGGAQTVEFRYEGEVTDVMINSVCRENSWSVLSRTPLRVMGDDYSEIIWQVIPVLRSSGILIREIKVEKPSLETVFLQLSAGES